MGRKREGVNSMSIRRIVVALAALFMFGFPVLAYSQPQIIFVVCRKYDASGNCHKCSDYFSVRSEEEAQRKCGKRGADTYFVPSVQAMFRWKVSHCTCEEED